MKYYPTDNRPMGATNPDRLVQDNLGHSAYSVVRNIYDNLDWLHRVYSSLPDLNTIYRNMPYYNRTAEYLESIVLVSNNLELLVNLVRDLPVIRELAPRIDSFTTTLREVQDQLYYQESKVQDIEGRLTSSIKGLEELFIKYEQEFDCLLQTAKQELCDLNSQFVAEQLNRSKELTEMYEAVQRLIPMLNRTTENHNKVLLALEHLNASDLVTQAIASDKESDYKVALKAIKQSESFGNNEEANRYRLNYKKESNNVFEVISKNNARLELENRTTGD